MADVIDQMMWLRKRGWLVVLKAMPKECSHIIQGSRSEYDGPGEDKPIGKGMWSCEAQWMGDFSISELSSPSTWALGRTPIAAINKVVVACQEAMRQRRRLKP
ncbi:MAG: hypothetical protein V1792_23405 [Pseudomonadota bacterium]